MLDYSKIIQITNQIKENNKQTILLQFDIQKQNALLPDLDNYDEDNIIIYLLNSGYPQNSSQFNTYYTLIKTNYKKRQDYLKQVDYLNTLNLILQQEIIYYKDNASLPTVENLNIISKNIGTKEDNTNSINYIISKGWIDGNN